MNIIKYPKIFGRQPVERILPNEFSHLIILQRYTIILFFCSAEYMLCFSLVKVLV